MVRAQDLIDRWPDLLSLAGGDPGCAITRPCAPDRAVPGGIAFLTDPARIPEALSSPLAVLVVRSSDATAELLRHSTRTVLASPNVELAMAWVCARFFPVTAQKEPFDGHRIHPTAVISSSAVVGEGTVIGPYAVIGAHCRIGRDCVIGGHAYLEARCEIGDGTHIHAQVFVGHSTVMGRRCEIHPNTTLASEGFGYAHDEEFNHYRHTHYGRLVLEDDVHVGACVSIDRGRFEDSFIGRGTKIDNYCQIGHNVRIGKNCLIAGAFGCAGSVTIGDHNVFGARTSITDHVTVGSNMRFGATSGLSKDVDEPGQSFTGYPLLKVPEALRLRAAYRQLPRIRKNVERILKKLGMR